MDSMGEHERTMPVVLRPDRRHSTVTLTLLPLPPIVVLFAASDNPSTLIRVIVVLGALAAFPLFVWHASALMSARDRLEVTSTSLFVTRLGRTTEFDLAQCGQFRPFSAFFIAQFVTFSYPEGTRRRTHTLAKYEPSAVELARTLNLARAMAAQPRATDREDDLAMAHLWRRHRPQRPR